MYMSSVITLLIVTLYQCIALSLFRWSSAYDVIQQDIAVDVLYFSYANSKQKMSDHVSMLEDEFFLVTAAGADGVPLSAPQTQTGLSDPREFMGIAMGERR